jgi:hypothetical protein
LKQTEPSSLNGPSVGLCPIVVKLTVEDLNTRISGYVNCTTSLGKTIVEFSLFYFDLNIKYDENECSISEIIQHCNLWGASVFAFEDASTHPYRTKPTENILSSRSSNVVDKHVSLYNNLGIHEAHSIFYGSVSFKV